jgi:hypothetical protein
MRQDLTSAGRSLLEWARQTKPQLRNLGELAQQLGDPAQAEAIGNLERVLYGTAGTPGLAGDLARVFARGPAFVSMRRSCSDEAELPELYSGHT